MKVKKGISKAFLLLMLICPVTAFSAQELPRVSDYISEYRMLGKIRSHSPALFGVVMDINLSVSEKCGFVVPVSYLGKTSIASFLLALSVMDKAKVSEPYFAALRGLECNDLDKGIHVAQAMIKQQ